MEPHRRVVQARGLLLAAEGVANEEIARRCTTTPDAVRWASPRWADGLRGPRLVVHLMGEAVRELLGSLAE